MKIKRVRDREEGRNCINVGFNVLMKAVVGIGRIISLCVLLIRRRRRGGCRTRRIGRRKRRG